MTAEKDTALTFKGEWMGFDMRKEYAYSEKGSVPERRGRGGLSFATTRARLSPGRVGDCIPPSKHESRTAVLHWGIPHGPDIGTLAQ